MRRPVDEFTRGWVACLRDLAEGRRRAADEGEPVEGRTLGQEWHADELRLEAQGFDAIADRIETGKMEVPS
jgi:hypothetical protein